MKQISIILILFICANNLYAQEFYRFSAEYSVKYQDANKKQALKIGKVFYDINEKQIVMKNGFPIREIIVFNETSVYKIRNKEVFSKNKLIAPIEFSIFHLALKSELENYGLQKAGYLLDTIKEDRGLIISIWSPPTKYKDFFGNIVVSTKNKQLFGIAFFDKNENLKSKHLFRDFKEINGFTFPTQVIRIKYENNKKIFEKTTYKKITINDTGNNEYYSFKINNL